MTAPTAAGARLAAARARLAARGVTVLYEDHLLLGVSKDAGVPSQGGPGEAPSLVDAVEAYRREAEGKPGRAFVGLVHRLDRNVSGALVVAKTSKGAARLCAAFAAREGVEKRYLAWVAGEPPPAAALAGHLVRDDATRRTRVARPDEPGARGARLRYEVEAAAGGFARLRVTLETGVTHQVRAQLAAAGLPLVGDAKYGGPPAPAGARCRRPALHAASLVVRHPVGGALVRLVAPWPPDLERLDRALGLGGPRRAGR